MAMNTTGSINMQDREGYTDASSSPLPLPSHEKETPRGSTMLMEDPVFLAITIVILFFVILLLLREVVHWIKTRRCRHNRQHGNPGLQSNLHADPSLTIFRDDPPPYPGKYSKTNINYLPSYDSAVKMVPDQYFMCNNSETDHSSECSVMNEHTNSRSETITGAQNEDQTESLSLNTGHSSRVTRNLETLNAFPDPEYSEERTCVNIHPHYINENESNIESDSTIGVTNTTVQN